MSEDEFAAPDMTNHFEEQKIGERVLECIEALKKSLPKQLQEIVWQTCNDYVEYATYEPLENWKDRTRHELIGLYSDKGFWGKTMRLTIWKEHRDEILPLIKDDVIEAQTNEIESLKERLDFQIRTNRREY